MRATPPALALLLVRLAAGRKDRRSIVQDLREEFAAMLDEGATPAQARRWYWRQVVSSVVPLLGARRSPIELGRHFLGSEGGMLHDVKLGARRLVKRPGFSLVVVLTLALGIGATTAVFSLVQGVLLTPPPYRDAGRLALVTPRYTGAREGRPPAWAPEQWLRWSGPSDSFESLAAYMWTFSFLVSDDGSEAVQGMFVTHDYFSTLGLDPVIGRVFDGSETGGDTAPPAVILGYDLWMRDFEGDPDVLGRAVPMARRSPAPVVVGVMPPGVRFLPAERSAREPNYDVNAAVDFFLPAQPSLSSDSDILEARAWSVVGRLGPGVGPQAARAELDRLIARQAGEEPEYEGIGAEVRPVIDTMNRTGRRILLPLLAAAALVLLISCGNAAALLLVRGLQRQGEYRIRGAIGAGRIALVRMVAVESLLLALAGGGVGVALAIGIVDGFKRFAEAAIPRLDAAHVGWPVVLFGLVSALFATVAAGVYPALRAARSAADGKLATSSSRTTAGSGERRILSGVTTLQAALTLTLLVGAGLMIRTMLNLAHVDAGFDTDRVVTMSVTAVEGDYLDFHERALERVSAIPGVERAAFAWGVPLTGNSWPIETGIEGRAMTGGDTDDRPALATRSVTPGYFELTGRPLVEGRDFRSSDDRRSPGVAVVNEAFVDRYLDGRSALGRRIIQRTPLEIVGVVADARTDDMTKEAQPEVYVSLWQQGAFSKDLVVRTAGDPAAVVPAVERAVHAVNPTAAVENAKTLSQIRQDSVATQAFAMRLLIGFALVASLLTLAGIYGVLSLSVASRRREIAIRTAVGAARRDLVAMVLGEGARVIVVGVAVGVVASIGLTRVLRVFLFEVRPTDPVTLVVMGTIFSVVALLACWAPARRAAEADPASALHGE